MKRLFSFRTTQAIAITFIAVIVWWSTTDDFKDENSLQQATGNHYIEIFMNDFEMKAMNPSGTPKFTLQGAYLEKYNNNDNTEIQQPVFHLLQAEGQWKVSADSAILNEKKNTIQLKDNVLMQQQNIEPATTIRTQSLLIHTDTQIAQTDAPIEIIRGNALMKSKGMTFNNTTSELNLSADVNGYYLPLPPTQ